MTETSSLLRNNSSFVKTFPLANSYPVTASTAPTSSLLNGTVSDLNAQDEEEYTIKCICIYTDDDGNTVYCPKCDTWQHIECYYHGKKVPEDHFCADCMPRDLDRKKATERQRRVREQLEGGDRKVKSRPSSKTSKKKHKDSIPNEQTNGWIIQERHDSISNGRDQPPPAKKPKTNHRTSGSIVSLNGESRKRAHSNLQSYPSPSKSPQDLYRFPSIPQYTTEFLELYERDEGSIGRYENEYTITASSFLSQWKADRSLVVNHPDQQPSSKCPFVYTSEDLENKSWPSVRFGSTTWDTVIDGKYPKWRYLVIESDVQKDQVLGEIRGEIGTLDEYCQQQSNQNRWHDLLHPDPFVFFHPHMNIYIDSRSKGTMYRYLRRSCHQNVTLKTFVSDDGEMRHCFVANQDIKSGTELTAAWFVNTSMFDMTANREDSEQHELRQCEWVSKVLANFGDCACDKTQCPWARFDRRVPARSIESNKSSAGRKKKGKSKQAISPLSTGPATNSRAGSEAVKGQDDDDQYDRRSTSESTRSGARSRDITPINVAVLDADPVLGNGLTARELRKIQAAEKAFERKEGASDKKKKKRTSGGSTLNTPNAGFSKQPGISPGPSDRKPSSGSPPPPRGLNNVGDKGMSTPRTSKPTRPTYVSVAVQTDPEECDLYLPSPKRRKFSTPTQRLLKKVLQDRMVYEQRERNSLTSPSPRTTPQAGITPSDVEMKDAGSATSPVSPSPAATSPSLSPTSNKDAPSVLSPSLTYPSQAAHTQTNFKAPVAPRLHLHTLPPVPSFPNVPVTTPGSANSTPAVATPSTAQSPGMLGIGSPSFPNLNASIVTPSPIKKKLSLGDYMSRQKAVATPVTEKSQAQANGGIGEEGRETDDERKSSYTGSDIQVDGAAVPQADDSAAIGMDMSMGNVSPIKDEDEPDYSPPGASPVPEEEIKDVTVSGNSNSSIRSPTNANLNITNLLAQHAQMSDIGR